MPEREAKIAQVSTEGGTDLSLKWIVITCFHLKKNQMLEMAKQNIP